MFDWEIENFLKENNYILNQHQYMMLCTSSPQLNHIKYDPYQEVFETWSDNNYFRFQVHNIQ